MRVVFMGTPSFAVPSLEALIRAHDVSLVVTRPDAVRGRGKRLEPSPVKEAAVAAGIEVLETKRVTPEVIERIAGLRPDVICVAAYGAILPDELLEVAPFGCINVHASLLPRWRGAAPIQRAILAGDKRAGISIMQIVHDLDAGPYCRTESVAIEDKNCSELTAELAAAGAADLINALVTMEKGTVVWREQDERFVTYAAKVKKQDLVLTPEIGARDLALRVQASTDAAPARATVCGRGMRGRCARARARLA